MAIDFRWLGIKRNIQPITGKTQKSLAESAMAYAGLKETSVSAPVAELV